MPAHVWKSMITENQVIEALRTVKYPGFSRDIVSFGLVKGVEIKGGDIKILLGLATRDADVPRRIHEEATRALQTIAGVGRIDLDFDIKEPEAAGGMGSGKHRRRR